MALDLRLPIASPAISLSQIPSLHLFRQTAVTFRGVHPRSNRTVTRGLSRFQFVGGDTARNTLPLLARLRKDNKGILFAYSVEDEEESTGSGLSAYKQRVEETIRCIDVAADFEDGSSGGAAALGRKTWVAVKLVRDAQCLDSRPDAMQSALIPSAEPLRTLSTYLETTRPAIAVPYPGHARPSDLAVLDSRGRPGMDTSDIKVLRELRDDLVRICTHAQRRGVRVIIDAEYTWWQVRLSFRSSTTR